MKFKQKIYKDQDVTVEFILEPINESDGMTLNDISSVECHFRKPDNTTGVVPATLTGNTVQFSIPKNINNQSGRWSFQVWCTLVNGYQIPTHKKSFWFYEL